MRKAYCLVVLCYVLALLVAWLILPFTQGYHILVRILLVDAAATFVVFAFSFFTRNSSLYDPYWSVVPIVLVIYFISLSDAFNIRQLLAGIIITVWGVRLTGNWLYTWRGLAHEDWRYVMLRERSGIFWWPVSLVGVHLIPTIVVFLGCIPLYAAMVAGDRPLNVVDGLAFLTGLVSIWLEYQSDVELHRFRATRRSAAELLDQGLWRYCRHPNYLGELGIWVSVFLFGYAALGRADPWMISGPVVMCLLFVFISIPMIEKKLIIDKPGYENYRSRTFALLPVSTLGKG
jgi:steroid 5-alpha reductase family enzyme